ncbi:hypothetical protein ACJZ2D_011229 [Fusarium nematophilum]
MARVVAEASLTGTVHTLVEAMSAPSAPPDVVVLDRDYREGNGEKQPSATEDLWLSSADGRYSSPPIPIRVGPLSSIQTFYVHRDILLRAEWFRKALCSEFKESGEQAIDLPEEDPAIFHFLVAFLYEGRFEPIRPAASVLEPQVDKGKRLDVEPGPAEVSDTDSTSGSSGSERSSGSPGPGWPRNRRRGLRARTAVADWSQDKHPGLHRPGCRCPRCLARQDAARCWQCGARRFRDAGQPHQGRHPPGLGHPLPRGAAVDTPGGPPVDPPARIEGEDFRTWLMTYELNLDVYICANRFLMDDFRKAVMRACIDMLETAGTDAAHPDVLRSCKKLYDGVPETDPLLKMVLARVGFLQPLLWKGAPEETSEFLVGNPELAAAILRETVLRHEAITVRADLPSMEHMESYGMYEQEEQNHRVIPVPPSYPY